MSEIENGLRADVMRKRMEDKNTLKNKGSLYVGTGEYTTINESYMIYKTEELKKGVSGTLLIKEKNQDLQWTSNILDIDLPNDIIATESKSTDFSSLTKSSIKYTQTKIKTGNQKFLLNLSLFQTQNYIIFFKVYFKNWNDTKSDQIINLDNYYIIGPLSEISSGHYSLILSSKSNVTPTIEERKQYIIEYGIDNDQFYIDFTPIVTSGYESMDTVDCTLMFIQ